MIPGKKGHVMREATGQDLVTVVRKCAGFLARGVVTFQEFTDKVFDEFAYAEGVCPDVVPEVWTSVPEDNRAAFANELRGAVQSDFRWRAFRGFYMTEDERRRDADLRTARVRAWAAEFLERTEVKGYSAGCLRLGDPT